MRLATRLLPALLTTVLSSQTLAAASPGPLGAYNIDLSQTSVSGISSGGFMTVQLHAAHADSIVGVGVFAGGPYQCSGTADQFTNVSTATGTCMTGKADAATAISLLNKAAGEGSIAEIRHQHNDKIWLYSGYNDGVVKQPTMDALDNYYRQLVGEGRVYYRDNQDAGHAQIVDNSHGQECVLNGGEFINNCKLDGAGQLLAFIYGTLTPKQTGELSGEIISFDQSSWFNGDSNAVMADTAYAYVPKSCADGEACRLHIAFHGCLQNAESIGDSFYRYAGYNEWADTNNFVVLYPQTTQTSSIPIPTQPFNPKGCWDWWGFTDPASEHANYATRSSVQIEAVWKMASQLASGYSPAKSNAGNADTTLTLVANDASDDAVSLVWDPVSSAQYQLTMSKDPSSGFTPVNSQPIKSGSYSVTGLDQATEYFFKLASVDSPASQSDTVAITTGNAAADCNPWYGTLTEHMAAGRAYAWWGGVFAVGSADYLGMFIEANTADATLLKTGALYYKEDNCPQN